MQNKTAVMLICILGFYYTGVSNAQPKVPKGKLAKSNAFAVQKQKQLAPTIGKAAKTEPTPPPEIPPHFLGEIRMFAGTFAPIGWQFCEGQILEINDHLGLFSLIGTIYGGDGRQTFGLPDLRQQEIPFRTRPDRPNSGPRYIISIKGEFPERP